MSKAQETVVSAVMDLIHDGRESVGRPFVLGICGAQGSGKSTLAEAVRCRLKAEGVRSAALSIDDLYLTKHERQRLAEKVHPLLATRGVPGTHDVALGLELMAAFDRGAPMCLPRFDKALDDRMEPAFQERVEAGCEVLIFEGWCVGARPERAESLDRSINALESRDDADGRWRAYVNARLGGDYQRLFARIDRLVLLEAPGFDVVARWRLEQEDDLRRSRQDGAAGLMDAAGVARFVQFYERLTRHILAEMPSRADLVVRLDAARRACAIMRRQS